MVQSYEKNLKYFDFAIEKNYLAYCRIQVY